MSLKKFDVVVWGATGFSGELVAAYLAKRNKRNEEKGGEKVSFAIAGRSEDKLLALKNKLVSINPSCKDVEILVGDIKSDSSMDKIVSSGRSVCACAGPFSLHGTPVVAACVRQGVHYCDITGESSWVKQIIDRFHQEAEEKRIAVVPQCGFDSVPSDIGCLYSIERFREEKKRPCESVKGFFRTSGGGVSGGTAASAIGMSSNKQARAIMADPYALNPPQAKPSSVRAGEKDCIFFGYNSAAKLWYTPFIMAITNTRIVRRSAAYNNYAPNFTYNEYMSAKNGFYAAIITFGLALVSLLLSFRLTRKLATYVVPKPGDGPSAEARANGKFEVKFVAESQNDSIVTKMTGPEAYEATGIFAAEAAIMLAKNQAQKSGVITPAMAFGNLYVPRLNEAGITLQVISK